MAPKKLYCAIQFLRSPYWMTDKFIVVPTTWISYHENQAIVSYPMVEKKKFATFINKRKPPCKNWTIFPVTVEFKTNSYEDAVLYIKLRQQMRLSYITSISQQNGDVEFVDVSSSMLNSAIVSNKESSTGITSKIAKKAIEDNLLEKIFDKISEVNKLLDQYIEIKRKCLNY